MAPPPSDPAIQRQKKGATIKFLIPLIYAHVLPLVRLTLQHKPVLRDRVFGAVLVGAFTHGFYLVTKIYDAESK
ncbi:SH3/FCH domain protein [Perilla frutescens var. hirtella]|nr:SH3/FCH domain protein [Perilla frutescens var. hirtella]